MIKKLASVLAPVFLFIFGLLFIQTGGADGTNLIANPSVELSVNGQPTSWIHAKTGTNTTAFNYLNIGHTGSHSIQVQMTKRSSGQAYWATSSIIVTPHTKYTFSDWYQSNVASTLVFTTTKTGGDTSKTTFSEPASSAWKQASASFTTPARAATLVVRQYINRVGQLTTDDYDLEGPAAVAPTVKLTAPLANATVKGTQTITATATDPAGVASVQFAIDNVNSGSPDATSPYSLSWDTSKVANGNHTITATATGKDGLTSSVSETVNVQNPPVTAPTVSISAPIANATVSGTQTVTATVTAGSYTIKNIQFQLDGANLGTADTTSPYSVSWNTANTPNGPHTLSAILTTTTTGVTATSTTVPVVVGNYTAPTVSITAPSAGATVNGTQPVTASASDAQGAVSVQFKLNGNNLGNPVTSAPYTVNWDTTTVTDGTYSLTAVATDSVNLSTTSAPVNVIVQNQAGGGTNPGNGPNLIQNPGLETSSNGAAPDDWLSSNWGTNTSTFSYLNTGHTGNHSVEVQTTAWTNGAANWYYNDIPITAGQTYEYSNWYESNVNTEVDAEVTMTDGSVNYYYLGTVFASTNWSQFTTTFTAPAGAKSMAIYQILAKVGYIISDDYSMETYSPEPFNRGIVTINFDDGWLSQYTNGVPALQANGLTATFFIITDSSITNPDPEYMNASQIITLKNDGYEIGNHTETHPDLTTLTPAQVQTEMGGAEAALQNAIGVTATDFAYPYGAYSPTTIAIGKQVGFISQRSVNSGFNTKDNLDLTQLKIEEVDADISPAQVQAWVNQAIAQKTWLILVYHEIDTVAPAGSGDDAYLTSPTNLNTELAYIKSTGVAVETTAQAINEILPQL